MIRKLFYALMALAAMTTLTGCEEEDLEKVYDEATSLDAPFLFSEGYEDTIAVAYDLPAPITDWLSMVRDDAQVCKLSIPGTHDTMTGMGFYQPVLKYVFNMTAISQVSTLEEQMACGMRFFDIRPVVSIDTLATDPKEKQILRLAHGISELDVTFEEAIGQLQRYLKAHPSEFFIAKLQADNGMENQNNWTVLLDKVLSKPKYEGLFVRDWRPDITVGEMRGKILWLSRYDLRPLNALFHFPVVFCDWPDEDPDIDETLRPEAQRSCAMYNMNDTTIRATLYKQDYERAADEEQAADRRRHDAQCPRGHGHGRPHLDRQPLLGLHRGVAPRLYHQCRQPAPPRHRRPPAARRHRRHHADGHGLPRLRPLHHQRRHALHERLSLRLPPPEPGAHPPAHHVEQTLLQIIYD